MRFYIGVDPGNSGGICRLAHDGETAPFVYDMLKLADATQRDIFDFLCEDECRLAFLERVHSMPGQGVSSTFKFGASFGELRMALVAANVPFELVTPGKWQRSMGCLSGGDKNVTKRTAQELFPDEKVTHWKADAILLAEYARREVT